MGILKRKAAPKQRQIVDQPWVDQTITQRERLKTHYSRNPEIEEYLQHALGVAHSCAALNATVCTAGVLRLYKRAGARTTTRGGQVFGSKSIEAKRMKRGRYGQKLADFTNGGAEMQEVVDHSILDLISKPNPMFPGESLTWLRWYYDFVCGNAYDKVLFQGSTPVQLSPLYAQFVRVTVSDGGEVGYFYGRSNEQWGQYTPDEVIHYKLRPSLYSPLYGMGAMHGILPYVDLITDTLVHDVSLAKNGMRPDFMMSVPEMTTDAQVEKFEKRFASKFRGAANWHKGLFVKGDAKLQTLTFSEKDILSLPKQDKAERIIREAFGHNESMNDPGGATYNGALVGFADQFLGGTIEPALQHDAAQKNERLLPMFGLDPDVYSFAYDPLVTKDEKMEAEMLRLDTGSGMLTINEARQERGLAKSDDPMADKLLFNGQPLGVSADPFGFGFPSLGSSSTDSPPAPDGTDDKPQPAEAQPKPAQGNEQPEGTVPVEGIEQPAKIEETALNGAQIDKLVEVALSISSGELPKEAGRAIILAAFPGIPPEKIQAIFAELVEGSSSPDQVQDQDLAKCIKAYRAARMKSEVLALESPMWRDCDECKRTKDDDIAADPLLKDALRKFQGQVQGVARDIVTDMQDEALEAYYAKREPNMQPLIDQAAGEFNDVMKDIVDFGVQNILENRGNVLGNITVPDEAFNIAPERALRFLETYTVELANDIAGTTADMAKRAVQIGLEQGMSIDKIAAEISDVPEYRAEAIARTETQRAVQAGKFEGAKAVDIKEKKIITAPGVRKSHAAIAAKGFVPMDEPFVKAGETVGGETFDKDVMMPPLGVNCRCSMTFKFPGEDE